MKNKDKAKNSFISVLKNLKSNIMSGLDARSREIFTDSFEWAINNPDEITYFTETEQTRTTHLPNVAFFANLMRNIEEQYDRWKSSECIITHDRQTEFEAALLEMHRMFSSTQMPKYYNLPVGWGIKMRALEKSTCQFQASPNNAGLQLCDMCLSVISRALKYELPNNQRVLNSHVVENIDSYFRLDYGSIMTEATLIYDFIMNTDLKKSDLEKGKELIALEEMRRKERIKSI